MKPNNDQLITETLAKIAKTLALVRKRTAQNNSESKLEVAIKTLVAQIKQLEPELVNSHEIAFSYEFYDNASEVVEQISQLRLSEQRKDRLQQFALFQVFNPFVAQIRDAVYQHEALRGNIPVREPINDTDSISTAQAKVVQATQNATQASAAAEKANAEGVKYLKKIESDQTKSSGLVEPELLNQSIQHTLAMMALNAAAVLAADEAALAITEMEDLLYKKKLS